MRLKCIVCEEPILQDETNVSAEFKAYPAHEECFNGFDSADDFLKFARESNAELDPNTKVPIKDVIAELGAKFRAPEWFSIDQLQLALPPEYVAAVLENAKLLERMINNTTIEAARYGRFHSLENTEAALDGIVYQYSSQFQPHDKSFGFALFKNGQMVANQGSFISMNEAKSACDDASKAQMGRLLE